MAPSEPVVIPDAAMSTAAGIDERPVKDPRPFVVNCQKANEWTNILLQEVRMLRQLIQQEIIQLRRSRRSLQILKLKNSAGCCFSCRQRCFLQMLQ